MEWVETRKKIGKPLETERALKIAINKLAKFKEQGHDPVEVLENSIFNNWQGLFEPEKEETNGHKPVEHQGQAIELPPCDQCKDTPGWKRVGTKLARCDCRKKAMAAHGAS